MEEQKEKTTQFDVMIDTADRRMSIRGGKKWYSEAKIICKESAYALSIDAIIGLASFNIFSGKADSPEDCDKYHNTINQLLQNHDKMSLHCVPGANYKMNLGLNGKLI